MTLTTAPSIVSSSSARAPRSMVISAWAIPILVVGQFAMMAIIPVTILLVGALRGSGARNLRWPIGVLAATYATPLAIWALRPDGAQSLSKDIHPVFVALIVAASAVVLISIHGRRRSPAGSAS